MLAGRDRRSKEAVPLATVVCSRVRPLRSRIVAEEPLRSGAEM